MAFDFNKFSSGLSAGASAAGAFGSAAVAGASASAEVLLAGGSRIQGQANLLEADTYGRAAEIATKNKALVEQNTQIQGAVNTIQAQQERRAAFKAMGQASADIGGAGLKETGSGLDILADSARQGEIVQQMYHLQGGIIQTQGQVDANTVEQQIEAYQTQKKTAELAADSSEVAAQAHEANAVGLRASASASKTGGVLSAIGSAIGIGLAIFGCWVAREVYGEDNPRWRDFQNWMYGEAPQWFFDFYMEHGEAFAGWLRKHPWAKPPVRWAMELTLRMSRSGGVAHA